MSFSEVIYAISGVVLLGGDFFNCKNPPNDIIEMVRKVKFTVIFTSGEAFD